MAETGRQPTHRSSGTRRTTLGLVTANIHLGVGATLYSGVLAAAERHDVNLVCFPGGPLRPGGAPRNAVYELVGPERLDGVICWTSTLGLPAAGDRAERLARRLSRLPVVSLQRALADHETLLLDSDAGMREAVGHLVEVHGRRRPACLRGPLANPVSLGRYRAYTAALTRYRIPRDRTLVSASADFSGGAGASAMRVLLDVRGLRPGRDFDAVVACSDILAAGALRLLRERGVRVPEDVAVVSFNDSPEARLTDPPLTSVALPFAELGELAVETLLARLRGTRPPPRRAVAGALVVRRSCGCPSPLVRQGAPPVAAPAPADDTPSPEWLRRPFARLPHDGAALCRAFAADLPDPGRGGTAPGDPAAPGGAFLDLLERLLGTRVHHRDEAAAWDHALLRLRDEVSRALPVAARPAAERLLGQARLMVADTARRLLERERWAEEQETRCLRELGTALTTALDVGTLVDTLARRLPGTGVPGCRLVLHDPGDPGNADAPSPLVRLALPRADRTRPGTAATGPADGSPYSAPYPATRLLPDDALPTDRRFTLVVEPLHVGDEQLGFALFDGGRPRDAARLGARYRALGDQLGAALKGIRLFDEVRRARDAAEQASRLRTRLLDNATDDLRTPVEAILRHTAADADVPPRVALRRVHRDAARLKRLIDDLLDLSRAETDALGLTRRMLDPRPVLHEAFHTVAAGRTGTDGWRLRLPRRLPAVHADAARLRQILVNLLAVAAGRAPAGRRVTLTAQVRPPALDILVTCPGLTFPPQDAAHVFQPFASGEPGMRLGLAVARRLAVLHGGALGYEHGLGTGGFRLLLPLPAPAEQAGPRPASPRQPSAGTRGTLLLASAGTPAPEVVAVARRQRLRLRRLHPDDDVASVLAELGPAGPAAVAWDAAQALPHEWSALHRLHDHPAVRHTPFLLYGPVAGEDLAHALHALRPPELAAPVVVVDASADHRERLRRLAATVLPGRTVRTAADGTAALALLAEEAPALLVVSRVLPDMDGFDIVEKLAEQAVERRGAPPDGAAPGRPVTPVLMLSDRGFTAGDVRRAEPHPHLVMLGRDILTEDETTELLAAMLRRASDGTPRSPAPVRLALAYLEQRYRHRLTRWQVAQAAGVSEDHLSRLFHREFGLTLWEYLTRLRIARAKERLRHSDESVQAVARAVGFHDRAYFSRVFRRLTGVAPRAYRAAG